VLVDLKIQRQTQQIPAQQARFDLLLTPQNIVSKRREENNVVKQAIKHISSFQKE